MAWRPWASSVTAPAWLDYGRRFIWKPRRVNFRSWSRPSGRFATSTVTTAITWRKKISIPKAPTFASTTRRWKRYIEQHIKATPGETVSFSWHGGEPTLLGVEFFRKAVDLQKKYLPSNKKIINGIQTNGTTIDDEWCEFLAKENFYIGLSLDGPRELHDHYRVTKGQKPTHKQVVQAFHMLRKAKVHVDLLCVVHDVNVKHPTQVYRYFKEIGGQYLQFLPLVEKTGDPNNPVHKRSVPSAAYGQILEHDLRRVDAPRHRQGVYSALR